MAIFIEGTVTGYGQQRTGQGQNGPWYDQPIIIQQFGQYGEPVAISFTKVDIINQAITEFPIGSTVKVSVNISSKQGTSGGYFTNIRAYKIEAYQAPTQQHHQQPAAPAAAPAPIQSSAPAPQAQAPQQQAQQYQIGQVANGHQWNGSAWIPVQMAPPVAPQAPQAPQAPAPQYPAPAPGAPIAANPAQQGFFNPDPNDVPF